MNSIISPLSQVKLKGLNKLKQKKYRYSSESYLCEGLRLFSTAIESNPKDILEIIVNDSFKNNFQFIKVLNFCNQSNTPIFSCSDKIFNSVTDEKSPSGIMFVMKLKNYQESDISQIKNKNYIYLENISDPGNLGTIIRTAAWFGFSHILLSPDSVDPFNPKVVRASAGGIFNINLYLNTELNTVSEFGLKNKYNFIGTTVENGESLSNWKVSDKNIIFFGNEANGLTESAIQLLNKKITVQGSGNLESLNLSVTAGIVMNHLYSAIKK
jgi:RNA methyltransferase, TrmH family